MTEPIGYFQAILWQGTADGAEGIADLGAKQTHDSNDDNSDECENNRVLNQTLTFFLGCKQHDSDSFLMNCVF